MRIVVENGELVEAVRLHSGEDVDLQLVPDIAEMFDHAIVAAATTEFSFELDDGEQLLRFAGRDRSIELSGTVSFIEKGGQRALTGWDELRAGLEDAETALVTIPGRASL